MSLYLKYRPRSFADVVGQEHIVTTLEHAVERDQLVHAYLFFGPRGTGKTSVARILAKILLIRGVGDEALQKQILKNVDDGTLVDLIEMDAATNRKIDDVRDLKEKVQFSPSVASAKVYIIDEVHMMVPEAFNALLKTLEEPPKHVYFILATTQLHKVPDTIQSRCQRFPFRLLCIEDIVRHLQNIADKERITVEREALRAIARHVNGGMRDAISLLDQLSSLEKVTETDVRLRIGESAEEEVENLWLLLDSGDRVNALNLVSDIEERGISFEVFLRQLLHRARRQLHENIAAKEGTATVLERIDAIFRALKDLRVSPVPSVALEVAVVEMCGGGAGAGAGAGAGVRVGTGVGTGTGTGTGGIGKRQENPPSPRLRGARKAKKQEEMPGKGMLAPGLSPETPPKAEENEATFVAKEVSREELEASWNDIIANVPVAAVRMSLKGASIEEVRDGCLTLGFSSKFHRDNVGQASALHEIGKALISHFHQPVRVECVLLGEMRPEEPEGKETVNVAEALAEIFGK